MYTLKVLTTMKSILFIFLIFGTNELLEKMDD